MSSSNARFQLPQRPHKRKGGGGDRSDPSKKHPAVAFETKVAATKAYFQRFEDAYDGKHSDSLGADYPQKKKDHLDAFKVSKCVVILSSIKESNIFPLVNEQKALRTRYEPSSQNPAIEIKIGVTTGNSFIHEQTLSLNSEQTTDCPLRKTIKNVDLANFQAAIRDDLMLPQLINTNDQITAIIDSIKNNYHENAVDCIRFQLREESVVREDGSPKSDTVLRLLNEPGFSSAESPSREVFHKCLTNAMFITIVRTAVDDNWRFVDQFWDNLIKRCLTKGIYWGYKLVRSDIMIPSGDSKTTKAIPWFEAVLMGLDAAPFLPWAKSDDGSYISFPMKTRFTSMKEFECRFIVALLQDTEYQREILSQTYSFSAHSQAHKIDIDQDAADTKHFTLHVNASKPPGQQLPAISSDTKFKIRRLDSNGQVMALDDIEARVADIPQNLQDQMDADFILDLSLAENASAPSGFSKGATLKVMLEMELDITAPRRQLQGILSFCRDATIDRKHLWLGFPALPEVSKATPSPKIASIVSGAGKQTKKEKSERNAAEKQASIAAAEALKPKYQKALETMRKSSLPTYNAHQDWQESLQVNQLQERAIRSCLDSLTSTSYVQGPPGTGKSVVAVNCALWSAFLSHSVLIASPTRNAGKANAMKFAKVLPNLPKVVRTQTEVVYFPTWAESIERMYEAQGYKPKRVTEASDEKFEDLQLWKHVLEYCREIISLLATRNDERARDFLSTFESLASNPASLIDVILKEFKQNFKALATEFIQPRKKTLIIIATCNNSATFAELGMCFSLIIVDEAAIAIEFDILVALQIPHDNLLFLGDHLQSRPVVISRGEYYDQLCISNFERILEHTSINRTMLKITYRFGKSIAEPVGMFGGYKGLASAHGEDSAFHNAFQNWWFSPANEVAYEPLLRKGVVRTKQEQEVQDLRRLCLSVGNGYSSLPRSGNTASSINYAHVKAGIAFLKALHSSEDLDLLSTDFVVVTPFESQAKLWREQLDIQWPNCGILVLTIGKSQGQEGKLVLFDTCLSCPTEGGYLGFLREWNRLNVAISRAEEVLICMLNVEVMREKLHSIYLQNPSWAYFLLDLIDRGDIIDLKVDHPTLLPLNAEEFRSGFWSNVQTAAVAKSIPLHHRRNGQGPSALLTTGKDSLSVQEEIYMKELEQLRKECRDNVRSTLSEEQAWQLQRAEEIKVRKGIAGLGAELPGGISSEDVEMGEEEVL